MGNGALAKGPQATAPILDSTEPDINPFASFDTEHQDFSFRSTNATPAKVSTIATDSDLVPDISARMIWLHCGIVSRLAAMERIR